MNRFLKKEWDETSIPESSYRRARDRAWERITAGERPVSPLRRLVPAAALGAAAALGVWIWQGARVRQLPVEPPAPIAVASRPPEPARIAQAVETAPRVATRLSRRPAAARQDAAPQPSRLVLNFVLPTSGVRMIWIMDKQFDLSGGTE